MDYKRFLEHIYIRHSPNVKLGLERMYDILEKMGNPEKKLKGIHIAGTNGKGSTAAISESLLLEYGHHTGLNTSPHLVDYTERFRVNGIDISSEELMALYGRYCKHFDDTEASFFEITTALAFKLFEDKKLDSAIMEVGLGGRLDGTNPFNATVSVITSISFDHTKTLGNTLEKIAFEKAGIIKKNVPVVIGDLPITALKVITKQAERINSPYFVYGKDFYIKNVVLTPEGTTFDYFFPKYNISQKFLKLNLIGKHQAKNAALALTAFFIYLDIINPVLYNQEKVLVSFPNIKYNNSEDSINIFLQNALKKVKWQGRIQVLSSNPLVILDGAHNDEGVSTLVKTVKEMYPDYKYHFLVAILRDKQLDKMIKKICSVAETIYISKNPSDRAADIQEQVDVAIACNTKYFADDNLIESLKKCLATVFPRQNSSPNEIETSKADVFIKEMIVITGSLYTIAEILKVKDDLFPSNK
ncbi:MAG: bifunctional folylpolyglutamate synthase/dihydrofolate synthase [Candidatus Cloacimonetes bacterium]|nr:bifunctional folylpolyglutamate synthase/dihydrofolate synthase [Candidatus Cloacimonadota bacterium]